MSLMVNQMEKKTQNKTHPSHFRTVDHFVILAITLDQTNKTHNYSNHNKPIKKKTTTNKSLRKNEDQGKQKR